MLHTNFTAWAIHPGVQENTSRVAPTNKVDIAAAAMARHRATPRVEVAPLAAATIKTAAVDGRPAAANTPTYIPIIPIIGTMYRYGDWYSYGTEDIASWILEVQSRDDMAGAVLEINSGGGEVDGIELLAEVIRQSSKPIVAHITGMGASGAYWVAAATRWIVMESATVSEVGSIGVLARHVDTSEALKKQGYKVTTIRAEGSENKSLINSYEPITEKGIKAVRAEITPIREAFEASVRADRPGISETVFASKGGMFSGTLAIENGMADEIGYLGNAIAKIMELAAA